MPSARAPGRRGLTAAIRSQKGSSPHGRDAARPGQFVLQKRSGDKLVEPGPQGHPPSLWSKTPAAMWYRGWMDQRSANERSGITLSRSRILKNLAIMREKYSHTEKITHKRPFISGQRRLHS